MSCAAPPAGSLILHIFRRVCSGACMACSTASMLSGKANRKDSGSCGISNLLGQPEGRVRDTLSANHHVVNTKRPHAHASCKRAEFEPPEQQCPRAGLPAMLSDAAHNVHTNVSSNIGDLLGLSDEKEPHATSAQPPCQATSQPSGESLQGRPRRFSPAQTHARWSRLHL